MATKRVGAVGLVAVALLSLSAAGSAQADPWVGKWKSVDLDGSNQTLTITKRADGAYDVILFDDYASSCGSGTATGAGVGTVSGNTMTGTTTITCADGRVTGTFPFKGTYNPKTDKFTDGLGVVWSRVKQPAPPKAKPLPLGRLVLTAREAAGLSERGAKPASAKKVLAAAVRPRKLPRFTAKQTQVAHFAKGKTDVWSIAFVMKDAKAARATSTAIMRVARRTRRGHALVLWPRNRVVGTIALTLPEKSSVRRRIARDYARLVDTRISQALGATAWTRTLSTVGPRGKLVSRKAALDLFALAYAPLPSTKRPPGPSGQILDATLAANLVLAYWPTLTPAQKAEAQRLLGLTRVSTSKRVSGESFASGMPQRRAVLGDPNFTPDPGFQKIADSFKSAYEARLKRTLKLKLVAGKSSSADWADELAVDGDGQRTNFPTTCRIRVGPKVQALPASIAPLMIGHEVFHCFEDDILTPAVTTELMQTGRAWVVEGMANWAAESVFPVSWPIAREYIALEPYFKQCRSYLFGLAYSASGFFGHYEDSVGNFWPRVIDVLEAPDSLTAFDRAGGNIVQFLQTWASSVMVEPLFGLAWTSFNPASPAAGAGCVPTPITGDAGVSAETVSTSPYRIESAPPDRPLLNIRVTRGYPRLSDSVFETTELANAWFWVGEPGKRPECPEDTAGIPPPAPELRLPAALALTGGAGVARGAVRFAALDEFCKRRQPPIVPIPPDPGGAGGGTGGRSCTSNCGRSFGDPHLITFDGVAYDFMAAGEFTLVRSKKGEFEIQVRQQPYPGSNWVSITTGAAMRVSGNRVVVLKGTPLQVRVNGRPVLVTQKGLKLPRGGTVRNLPPEFKGLPRKLEVTSPDGTFAQAWEVGDSGLALLVSPAAGRAGTLVGLLGNADGRKTNDFVTRSGRTLPASALSPGTRGRTHRALYRIYGNSWRITLRRSLFDYAPGQSPVTYTDLRFPAPAPTLTLAAGDKRRLARAQAVCRRMRIKDPAVEASCVVDVLLTGNFDFARSATRLDRSVRVKAKSAKPQPKPKPAPKPTPTIARVTLIYNGKTYTYVARKGFTEDGCTRDDVGGIDFRITLGTQNPTDKFPYFELALYSARKDGTYKGDNMIVQAGDALFNVFDFTVTLAGKRTRGTFKGKAPDGNAVSGSFRC